jgi:hypothetical protein
LSTSGALDAATWKKLTESPEPALIEYTISAVDTKGPFVAEIPDSYEKKAELKRLDYTGPIELLAERFHMNEDLLRQLNRGKSFDQAGTVITVANVGVKPVRAAHEGREGRSRQDTQIGARARRRRKAPGILSGVDRKRGETGALGQAESRPRRARPDLHLQSGIQVPRRERPTAS